MHWFQGLTVSLLLTHRPSEPPSHSDEAAAVKNVSAELWLWSTFLKLIDFYDEKWTAIDHYGEAYSFILAQALPLYMTFDLCLNLLMIQTQNSILQNKTKWNDFVFVLSSQVRVWSWNHCNKGYMLNCSQPVWRVFVIEIPDDTAMLAEFSMSQHSLHFIRNHSRSPES